MQYESYSAEKLKELIKVCKRYTRYSGVVLFGSLNNMHSAVNLLMEDEEFFANDSDIKQIRKSYDAWFVEYKNGSYIRFFVLGQYARGYRTNRVLSLLDEYELTDEQRATIQNMIFQYRRRCKAESSESRDISKVAPISNKDLDGLLFVKS